jgi:hypothetical protein
MRFKWPLRIVGIMTTVAAVALVSSDQAYAYISRTPLIGSPGTIETNGQITGGSTFIVANTNDISLQSMGSYDYFRYGADGLTILNDSGQQLNIGGIWHFDHILHDGTPITQNNGYLFVTPDQVNSWILAAKGDLSYVNGHLLNTVFEDWTSSDLDYGQTVTLSNLANIIDESGGEFIPNPAMYNSSAYATNPAYASIGIVGGTQTVKQGAPVQFYDHAYVEAYHSGYHFEYVEVFNSNGQDVTSQAFNNSSLQGRAAYNGETILTPDGHVMTEVDGGGATTEPPTTQTWINGGSSIPNTINTSNLQPGRYTVRLWVKDWYNRGNSSPATATFTVTNANGGNPTGGGNGGGGTGTGGTCPPVVTPPQPTNYVENYYWSPDGSGGQILTWVDSNWVLTSVTSNGCPAYQWVDQPKTYTHDYPLYVSNFAVTGLFYDPGTPSNLWSPTNTTASQSNQDQFYDGSTYGGDQPSPTYGNPNRAPAIYARVGGGFSFRVMWTGSPHDMPASASVSYQLSNPNGSLRMWSKSFNLLPQTIFNQGDVPVWDPSGNGYPPPATEYGWAYTTIPKYATQGTPYSYSQLTAWNLSGDPSGAAHISASVTFSTGTGSSVTWNNGDLAQMLNYPTFYFIHETAVPNAPYMQNQPTYSRNYSYLVP